jgi:hypothetical protein
VAASPVTPAPLCRAESVKLRFDGAEMVRGGVLPEISSLEPVPDLGDLRFDRCNLIRRETIVLGVLKTRFRARGRIAAQDRDAAAYAPPRKPSTASSAAVETPMILTTFSSAWVARRRPGTAIVPAVTIAPRSTCLREGKPKLCFAIAIILPLSLRRSEDATAAREVRSFPIVQNLMKISRLLMSRHAVIWISNWCRVPPAGTG